jgi:N-acetylneuraminate synthase/N,N'-diacetyllegionaminate synthase
VKIGKFDTVQRPLLIAEIGNNHEGDPAQALALVDSALECGVDAVKIQVIDPARLVNISQKERIAQLSRFSLSTETTAEMAARTKRGGALFMASAFDTGSLSRIAPLCDAIKIASGDLDFQPLLAAAARLGKPIVLSTGMATLEETRTAVNTIKGNLPRENALEDSLALLHCVSLYPTQPAQANLRGMKTLAGAFSLTVGYSDHTLGIEVALLALGLGARIVEKHFTLDKTRTTFRDHALSADPGDMRRLAGAVRSFAEILGDGEKGDRIADRSMAEAVRRSIVASRDLSAGTRLRAEDLDFVRPGTGIPPSRLDEVIGKKLTKPLARHAVLDWKDLE